MRKWVAIGFLWMISSIGFVVSAQTMPDFVIRTAQEINAIYGAGTVDINHTGWDWRWGTIGDNYPLSAGCNQTLNLPPSTHAKQYYRVFFDTNFDGVDEWAMVVYDDYSYFGLCTAQAYSCGLLEPRLAIDGVGHVDASSEPNNLRAQPGESGQVTGKIPPSNEFSVLDGPRCVNDTSYWLVNYDGSSGWTAEGEDTEYWLIPGVFAEGGIEVNPVIGTATPIPTSAPLITCAGVTSRLSVGIMAQVTPGVPNNLRAFPGESADYLGDIPPGQPFQIIGGPQCNANLLWWQVNYQGTIGWTAEAGSANQYWIEPVVFDVKPISSETVNALVPYATLIPQTPGTPLATYVNAQQEVMTVWSDHEAVWRPLDATAAIPNIVWTSPYEQPLANPPLATYLDAGGEVVKLTRNPANNQLVNWERGTFFDEFDLSLSNPTLDIAAFHPDDGDMILLSQRGKGFVLVNSNPESPKYRQVAQAARLLPPEEVYTQMEFSDNGQTMVGLTDANNLVIWRGIGADPETWSAVFPIELADNILLNDVALSPDGNKLVVIGSQIDASSGQGQGFYTLYNLDETDAMEINTGYFGAGIAMTATAFSPDGTMFVVATSSSQLAFIDANTTSELRRVGGFTGLATNITFNADSTLMATTSSAGVVTMWHIN